VAKKFVGEKSRRKIVAAKTTEPDKIMTKKLGK
jgi:hypothetical protein